MTRLVLTDRGWAERRTYVTRLDEFGRKVGPRVLVPDPLASIFDWLAKNASPVGGAEPERDT